MIIVGSSLPREYLSYLQAAGHAVVILPPDPHLPDPVASHPDMLLFPADQSLITDRTYYTEIAHKELGLICQHSGLTLHLTDELLASDYPNDIRFNSLHIGKFLFCHPSHTSSAIRDWATHTNHVIIPTKQGYSRCSACPVGDGALITADPSIAAKAKENGLDVCIIRQGHILLPGYSYGFIGGCCGSYQEHLFFCGDLKLHPDGDRIISFVKFHGRIPQTIPNLPLLDVGSMFFIPD